MDDWTYPYQDVDIPDTPLSLNRDGRVMEARRARARQAEAARVAELERIQAVDAAGYHAEGDVPLPFATPPSSAVAF